MQKLIAIDKEQLENLGHGIHNCFCNTKKNNLVNKIINILPVNRNTMHANELTDCSVS